jgi:hypothetical protein
MRTTKSAVACGTAVAWRNVRNTANVEHKTFYTVVTKTFRPLSKQYRTARRRGTEQRARNVANSLNTLPNSRGNMAPNSVTDKNPSRMLGTEALHSRERRRPRKERYRLRERDELCPVLDIVKRRLNSK